MMIFPSQPTQHPHTPPNIWHMIFVYPCVWLTGDSIMLRDLYPLNESWEWTREQSVAQLPIDTKAAPNRDFHFKTVLNGVDWNDLTSFCKMTVAWELGWFSLKSINTLPAGMDRVSPPIVYLKTAFYFWSSISSVSGPKWISIATYPHCTSHITCQSLL